MVLQSKTHFVSFKVEDKVLLNLKDYQTSEQALASKYIEPFTIVDQLSKVTFILELSLKYKAIHSVFHI